MLKFVLKQHNLSPVNECRAIGVVFVFLYNSIIRLFFVKLFFFSSMPALTIWRPLVAGFNNFALQFEHR